MRKKTVFIYIVVLLMIIATTCIYILKNEKDTGKEIIISKESTKDYVLEKVKSGFVTYNGTELISYDTDMEQKWVIAIEEEEADLFSNEDYILLANPESDELYLVKDGTLIHNIETGKNRPSITGFLYICEYLGVQPQEFFDTETISPTKATQIMQEIGKLSPDKADHILEVIKDLAEK